MTHRKTYRSLAEYFQATGITQEELAAKLGVSQSYMSLLAKGSRRPSLPLGLAIERETGVPVEALSAVAS